MKGVNYIKTDPTLFPLDYSLSTSERVELIKQLDLKQANSFQLEFLANYILGHSTHSYVKSKSQPTDPNQLKKIEISTQPAAYTKPKLEIDNSNPYISQIRDAIAQLKTLFLSNSTPWKLKRIAIELQLDIGLINLAFKKPMEPKPAISAPFIPPDIDQLIDPTNSFHIAKIIGLYSQLRQSDYTKPYIEWIDEIIELAPLKDWQRHILIRRIDGAHQITIGRELGEIFGRIISPSYMSQTMRGIYRTIALEIERQLWIKDHSNDPAFWRTCRKCGEEKIAKLDFYPSKPNICKQCGKIKKEVKI